MIGESRTNTAESSTDPLVTYRIVAGHKRRQEGSVMRQEFAGWARYEVYLNENSWQRVATTLHPAVTGDAA